RAESQGPERPALPRARAGDPRRVRLRSRPASRQGFPALDHGPQTVPSVDRLGRHVLRAVPARLRQDSRVGHRATREAVPQGARDRKAHVVAGARQPRPRHGDESLGRDRHVLQGLPGCADQDRHRGGRRAAQADLRVSTNPAVGASGAAALEARSSRSVGLSRLREIIERESVFSWLILTPPLLFLLCFLGYPFFYGVYLSFFRREVASSPTFVGFGNFVTLASDPIFWQSVGNTIKFTAAATVLKGTRGAGGGPLVEHKIT